MRPRKLCEAERVPRPPQIACIATDADLNELDEGVEYIVKTDKDVLDRMNEWSVLVSRMGYPS